MFNIEEPISEEWNEWFESPVTKYFLFKIDNQRKEVLESISSITSTNDLCKYYFHLKGKKDTYDEILTELKIIKEGE